MGLIITEAIVIAIAIAIALRFKKNISRTVPISVTIVVLSLFVFGVCNVLILGAWLVIAEGIVSSIYIMYKLSDSEFRKARSIRVDFSLILFITSTILLFFVFKEYLFCYYDEFSHWGTVVKDIYIHKELCPLEANETTFINYPPGLALLEWFVMFCNREYSEGLSYAAYALLGISFLLVPFENKLPLKEVASNMARVAVIVYIPFLFFSDIWSNLQVDALLGIVLFFTLYIFYISLDECDTFEAVLLSAGSIILTLTKDSGVAIAIISSLGICLYYFIKKRKGIYKCSFIIIIPTMVARMIWEMFWRSHGTSEIVLKNIANDYRGESFYKPIIRSFIQKTFDPIIIVRGHSLNIYEITIILIAMGIVTVFLEKNNKGKLVFVYFLSWSVFLAYTAGTLYVYLTNFPYESAIQIPSFQRYVSTILVGIALFCLIALIETLNKRGRDMSIIISSAVIIALCLITGGGKVKEAHKLHLIRQTQRDDFKFIESIDFKGDDLVYVVTQRNGMAYYVANYTIAPGKVEPAYIGTRRDSMQFIYSLGKRKEGEASYISWDISCEEWVKYLKDNKFDYVYLHIVDEYFVETYGELFEDEIKDESLYTIRYDDEWVKFEKYVKEWQSSQAEHQNRKLTNQEEIGRFKSSEVL